MLRSLVLPRRLPNGLENDDEDQTSFLVVGPWDYCCADLCFSYFTRGISCRIARTLNATVPWIRGCDLEISMI